MKNITELNFMQEFIRMADNGANNGWHERNGGNLSYRMKKEDVESAKEFFNAKEWRPIGTSVPKLANEYFLVTGSGKYFSNVKRDPADTLAIIEIDDKGENFRIVWGLINGGRPTSELPSHLMNHEVKKEVNENYRLIYHAHPANLIALTFILPCNDEIFTRELWEAMTECAFIFPDGVGVLPWMVPGGRDIAVASSRLMKTYNVVVWSHHGLFVAGEDFDSTFGLMHAIEKSAEILLKVYAATPYKRQTITPDNFREFAKAFGFNVSERFLFEKEKDKL